MFIGSRDVRAHALIAALCAALAGCEPDAPPPQYRVTFDVHSDRAPVPGAQLVVQGRVVGLTDARGDARLEFTGRDGQTVSVVVRCPEGLRSPDAPVAVALRTLTVLDRAVAARGIMQSVDCPPVDRSVAVVVRTGGRAGLPVMWQGREVARTDEAGLAHLTFRAHPATSLELLLATADAPTLRPQNPRQLFIVPDADDVVVWTAPFETVAPRPSRHGGGGHRIIHRIIHGPIRIR